MAHEEVVSRALPIFSVLLHHDRIDDSCLRALWAAPVTKSSAVATATTTLLIELLRSQRCPPRTQIAVLDALHTEGSANLSMGHASLLASLAPTYAALPVAISHRMALLLWHLLAQPTTAASPAAAASLRATLIASLRQSPPEQRVQAVALAVRPLQRACNVPLASPRPGHRRNASSQGSQGGGSGSGSYSSREMLSAAGIAHGGGTGTGGGRDSGEDPPGSVYAAAADGIGLVSAPGSGRGGGKLDLPPALAAAGDKLPLPLALEVRDTRRPARRPPPRACMQRGCWWACMQRGCWWACVQRGCWWALASTFRSGRCPPPLLRPPHRPRDSGRAT